MWIKKTAAQVVLEKQVGAVKSALAEVLIGLAMWYCLVKFSSFINLPFSGPASGYVAFGVGLMVVVASLADRKARAQRESTVVCDRCHALKTADQQAACRCGGTYISLKQMKWINPASAHKETGLLPRLINHKFFRKSA